jgi:xanthine/CO dehydrogenase XdhC/CoxF family maturation factor
VSLSSFDAAELSALERAAEASLPINLLLAGAGADLLPLARIAEVLGWDVAVAAPRVTAEAERRWAALLERPILRPDEIPSVVTASTAALIATHHYLDDAEMLRALRRSSARYIGILGSRARVSRMIEDTGDSPDAIGTARIHGPAGLDLGAETPEEIALSIISEIQAVLSGGSGRPLRAGAGAIHERPRSAVAIDAARETA